MTDETTSDAAQEAVSRLLADARHAEPLPGEVAARLDGVLAQLSAERAEHPRSAAPGGTAEVVSIASRRRQRLATGLVAAATVVTLGVALPNLIGGSGGDDGASDTAGGQAADSGEELQRQESGAAPSDSSRSGSEPAAPGASLLATPPTLSPDRFKRDARAARQAVATGDAVATGCGVPPLGDVVTVRYRNRDGYLLFGAPAASGQRVELYLCPAGELARRAVIPAP